MHQKLKKNDENIAVFESYYTRCWFMVKLAKIFALLLFQLQRRTDENFKY